VQVVFHSTYAILYPRTPLSFSPRFGRLIHIKLFARSSLGKKQQTPVRTITRDAIVVSTTGER